MTVAKRKGVITDYHLLEPGRVGNSRLVVERRIGQPPWARCAARSDDRAVVPEGLSRVLEVDVACDFIRTITRE